MKCLRIIFSLMICSVMLLSATASVAAGSGYVRGDADGDGTVTILDATTIQRKLVQLPTPSFN